MRKNWFLVIIILIFSVLSATPTIATVFADSFYKDNTVISEMYLDSAEFSKDLSNVSYFDINNNFVVYTTNNNKIQVLNRRNKAENIISLESNVEYLKLIKNYLFVCVNSGTNKSLKIFDLSNFAEIKIKTNSNSENYVIEGFSKLSIVETANNNVSQIFVSILNPTYIKYFYINIANNGLFIDAIKSGFVEVKDINKSTTNPITTLSNITNSNENIIYVVGGDGENQNKLFKISIGETVSIGDATLFYPSSATELVVAQKNLTDYIIAISAKHICIVETDLALNESIEQTNWKKGDETIGDNGGFALGTINNPIDVKFFNGKMFVSDKGTKSIQSFNLNISAETKIIGDQVIIASVCGIEGRFNKNSTLTVFPNDKILVGDPLNNRIQIINNNTSSSIDNLVLSSTNANYPISLSQSNILYSINLSGTTSALVLQDLETTSSKTITNYTRAYISTSIPTILSVVQGNNKAYILTTAGILFYEETEDSATYLVFNSAFNLSESSILTYLPNANKLLLYSNNRFFIINLDGTIFKTSNLFENISSLTIDLFDNIYALQGSKIIKLSTIQNFQKIGEISNERISNFSNISINCESGIIYAFNNSTCGIETIINPDFNYIENTTSIKTANAITYIFAKPSGLNASNIEVLETLEIDSFKDIFSKYPISVDGNSFFIVYMENGYGFINAADVFFNDEDVMNLQEANARIKGYEKDQQIKVYKFNNINDSEIKTYLTDDYRIYVENFDKDSPLTYISFYDENQRQQVGYVETKFIKFNQLSSFQSTAIIILAIALICGILLFIFYKKANDRKKA